jgi:osmotically-inducible protein OsmY
MQEIKKWLGASAIVFTSLAMAGCADRNNNGQPESPATTSEIDKTTANAGNSIAGAAGNVADAAGNAVDGAGKAIEGAADAVVNTPKIKSALLNNPSLKGSNIDVDTKGAANTINLTGTVRNAAQKTLAQNIAQKAAGASYKVNNQLKVSGGAAASGNKGN